MRINILRTEAASFWLRSGDLNMHYLDWGGSAQPLIALHGAATAKEERDDFQT